MFYLPPAKSERKTINPTDTTTFVFFSHYNEGSKVDMKTFALGGKESVTENGWGGVRSGLVRNFLSRFS